MKIRVLGAAAGGGFPQWNCNCPNCRGVREGRIRARPRTQSSIAVTADEEAWVLFNASPDILAQVRAFPALQPGRRIRDTGIVALVLVDSQIDHSTGLLMLREGEPLEVYCTERVREDLTVGFPLFNVLSHYCKVNWHPVHPDPENAFHIPGAGRLRFTAVPLKSKAPPYSPHRESPAPGDNIGLKVQDPASGKTLFYAPGLARMEPHLEPLFENSDCLMVDGTFWSDDEMVRLGISDKRAQDIGHLPQSGEGGMLKLLARHRKPRKILIHINNTNPILDEDSPERSELTAAGIEVAYDGMEIEL